MDSDAVLVWWEGVDSGERAASRYAPLLSAEEKARADAYKSDLRAAQFITGRGRLRMILGEITGFPPAELRIVKNVHGKPQLDDEALNLYFNVAHSKDGVLIAVTRIGPVGIDLEAVRPVGNLEKLARRWFSSDDLAYLWEAPPEARLARFFWLWTRKEALFKAWGTGIAWGTARAVSVRHNQVSPVSPDHRERSGRPPQSSPRPGPRESEAQDSGPEQRPWSICSWCPRAGYIASVAAPGDSWRLVLQ